jgi:hypothetical protein
MTSWLFLRRFPVETLGHCACTSSDAEKCGNDYADCIFDLEALSETYEEDAEACSGGWCDCLDNQGCDEYLDEAGCE